MEKLVYDGPFSQNWLKLCSRLAWGGKVCRSVLHYNRIKYFYLSLAGRLKVLPQSLKIIHILANYFGHNSHCWQNTEHYNLFPSDISLSVWKCGVSHLGNGTLISQQTQIYDQHRADNKEVAKGREGTTLNMKLFIEKVWEMSKMRPIPRQSIIFYFYVSVWNHPPKFPVSNLCRENHVLYGFTFFCLYWRQDSLKFPFRNAP